MGVSAVSMLSPVLHSSIECVLHAFAFSAHGEVVKPVTQSKSPCSNSNASFGSNLYLRIKIDYKGRLFLFGLCFWSSVEMQQFGVING